MGEEAGIRPNFYFILPEDVTLRDLGWPYVTFSQSYLTNHYRAKPVHDEVYKQLEVYHISSSYTASTTPFT